MTTAHLFAFNSTIAAELKERLAKIDDQGRDAFSAPIKFTPSEHQKAFFKWLSDNRGSCILKAVAGSGKTTSIVTGLRYVPGLTVRDVRASTFHSVGFNALCKKLGNFSIKPDANKVRKIAKLALTERELDLYEAFSVKLVALAKGEGLGAIAAGTETTWQNLVSHHDLSLDSEEASEEEGIQIARRLLRLSNDLARPLADRKGELFFDGAPPESTIDFDDMLYIPLLWKCRLFQDDLVFVDEAQDTNPVRRAIAKLKLKPGGRLIAVGDPRQAIYGFCHPAGELILTPQGYSRIERLKKGDAVITSNTSGELSGWTGNQKILETHKYYHTGQLLTITTKDKTVSFTPHHKLPVRIDTNALYYTYMMRRCGVYRVGYCQAYADGQFMLQVRRKTEKADCAWLLGAHSSKKEAQEAEAKLLLRVKGTTFFNYKNEDVAYLPTDEIPALKILSEHGRMADFPLLVSKTKQPRIASNGTFITEACNLLDGMLVAFYSDNQTDTRKRGRGQQKFVWSPITVSAKHFSGHVYGITVPESKAYKHGGYLSKATHLYFAGDILVHNTGASADALDLIAKEFSCVELPLTVSYRCPAAVAERVRALVPYFEVPESTDQGSVKALTLKDALPLLSPRDAIVCRQTAPLVSLALSLIATGTPCHVLGREIGTGLVNLVKKLGSRGMERFLGKLEAYREREKAKHIARGEELKAAGVEDKVDCILAVIESLPENERTVPGLARRIESLFSDDSGSLSLATVHKVKGKEYGVVAVLMPELMPSKWARQQWQVEQELNLQYVAWTRAQRMLIDLKDAVVPRAAVKKLEAVS